MTKAPIGLACLCFVVACGNGGAPSDPSGGGTSPGGSSATGGTGKGGESATGGSGGSGVTGGSDSGGSGGSGDAGGGGTGTGGSGGSKATWGLETRPTGQTCLPPASQSAAAMLLSATGCVDPMDPTRPAPTLIPYSVSSPLWSDAADKTRFFALPDGATIDVKDCARNPDQCAAIEMGGTYEDEGDWTFPVGTVFVKMFAFGGRLVETRLLVRVGEFDFWGFSYRWRDDQTDADLLASNVEGYDADVMGPDGVQTWHFPSRTQCFECHTSPAGVYLGPETASLNTDFTYPNGVTGNQLENLDHIGVFTASPDRMAAFPTPTATSAPLEERARSYLHANCSMCHRPGSNFTGFDARFSTPFADTLLCNEPPEKGDLGAAGAMKITPGNAAMSVVSLRMHARDIGMMPSVQMPRLGTNVVDDDGVAVIDEWIDSLTGCP